ncbi:MAG TPA: LPS assembly protein LptD [Candidatus Omnitrophota bacterium]|nr:LPS assembly protein LptD [Candidatus Omnitrophota bacterium]
MAKNFLNSNKHSSRFIFLFLFVLIFVIGQHLSFAQDKESVELNVDTVEYSVDGQSVYAKGNVIIIYKGATLKCEEAEFYRGTKHVRAKGHVRLVSVQGELSGENLDFNLETMTGTLENGRVKAYPYYGVGEKISQVSRDKVIIYNGYFTTSDYDNPGYRLKSNKIEIYPRDKLIARNVRVLFGKAPVMYFSRYTQNLNDKKSWLTFTPGYTKDWGVFLLTKARFDLNKDAQLALHLDARERKDIAWGADLHYRTEEYGLGIFKTYYMNERTLGVKRFYDERVSPTVEKERFKVEWRHKWQINEKTDTIWQYYKLSDATLLKDYFRKEHDEDSLPSTYSLTTRRFANSALTFRTDVRVNRFESKVERLPEVRYDFFNQKIGETGLYLKNTTIFSHLLKKFPSPSNNHKETNRFHMDQELSRPMKIGFLEFKPYVGTEQTYYSQTAREGEDNVVRGFFKTGASVSTKFYKILDTTKILWVDVDKARHVLTPGVNYLFSPPPTVSSSYLDSFDDIDSRSRAHKIVFSLENKIQAKQNERTRDMIRALLSTDFLLKENPGKGGFHTISSDIDIKPTDWLTFYFDSEHNAKTRKLDTANFDLYINNGKKWAFGIGKRFNREVDDQITLNFQTRLNQKWAVSVHERFDVSSGTAKHHEYVVSRDLHSWTLDIRFTDRRGEGSEIMLVFTLKAFPDLGFDVGTGFNKRKAGSEISE